MQQESETTAVTSGSVVSGLGYPNGRAEASIAPTGWQPSNAFQTMKVSRETI